MPDETNQETASPKKSLIGRLLSPILHFGDSPLYNSLFLAGAVAVLTGAFLLSSLGNGEPPSDVELLDLALENLDNDENDQARSIALTLVKRKTLPYARSGEPLYVFGAVMAREAKSTSLPEHREKIYLVASRYLEQASEIGFPAGHEGRGNFLLGVSMFHGRRYAASLGALNRALDGEGVDTADTYRLLSVAYLRQSPPMLDQALEASRKFLASPELAPATRYQGLINQSEVLLAMEDYDRCGEALKMIPSPSKMRPMREAMTARMLLAKGESQLRQTQAPGQQQSANKLFHQALDLLREEEQRDFAENAATAQIRLLMGVCQRRLGDNRAAEAQFARVRGRHFSSDEGLAAMLQEAEIQIELKKYDDALDSFRRVIGGVDDITRYSNAWVSLSDLQRRTLAGYNAIMSHGRYQEGIELCKLMPPTFAKADVAELVAQTYQRWGDDLSQKATKLDFAERTKMQAEARRVWRLAGKAHRELADLRLGDRSYTTHIWNSASNYLRGQNYRLAEETLEVYRQNEQKHRLPRAMVALGEARLAQRRVDDALAVLLELIETHPRHPTSYRARLLASSAHSAKGELDEAIAILEDNFQLAPASKDWRLSKFAKGRLFMRQAALHETNSRANKVDSDRMSQRVIGLKDLAQSHDLYLKAGKEFYEIIRRAERNGTRNSVQAIEASYYLAETQRQAAKWPRKRLPVETITTTRNALNRQINEILVKAIGNYDQLLSQLTRKQESTELLPIESLILRNCYFNRADCYHDLAQYSKAIQHYSTATNRYPTHPSSLEAFVQMSSCHRRLNEPEDARGMLERAKVVLSRITDADFEATTRYTRARWVRYLDWLINL